MPKDHEDKKGTSPDRFNVDPGIFFRERSLNNRVFIIGGCRSGKSRYALELADRAFGKRRIFIATCIPCDDEIKERIMRHQKERGQNWLTLEVPVRLPETIIEKSREADVILIDCLTLWISNLLLENVIYYL